MMLLLAFLVAVVAFAVWELHDGPRWRGGIALVGYAVVALGYLSQRFVS